MHSECSTHPDRHFPAISSVGEKHSLETHLDLLKTFHSSRLAQFPTISAYWHVGYKCGFTQSAWCSRSAVCRDITSLAEVDLFQMLNSSRLVVCRDINVLAKKTLSIENHFGIKYGLTQNAQRIEIGEICNVNILANKLEGIRGNIGLISVYTKCFTQPDGQLAPVSADCQRSLHPTVNLETIAD